MNRALGFLAKSCTRNISCSHILESHHKLNHMGTPQEKIPEWADENVDLGYVILFVYRIKLKCSNFKCKLRENVKLNYRGTPKYSKILLKDLCPAAQM